MSSNVRVVKSETSSFKTVFRYVLLSGARINVPAGLVHIGTIAWRKMN